MCENPNPKPFHEVIERALLVTAANGVVTGFLSYTQLVIDTKVPREHVAPVLEAIKEGFDQIGDELRDMATKVREKLEKEAAEPERGLDEASPEEGTAKAAKPGDPETPF